MTQYIDKSALVAELKRIEHETNYEPFTGEVLGKRCACRSLLSFIDTIEVKDVDLEKEIKHFTMSKELYEADSVIKAVAKHFFELGQKAQKGE